MFEISIIAWWGLCNRLWGWSGGWDKSTKPSWLVWVQKNIFIAPILSILVALSIYCVAGVHSYPEHAKNALFVVVLAGWWLGRAPGHGLYWAAYTGRWDKKEKEIGWIDRIVLKEIPFISKNNEPSNRARGRLAFVLRGAYYLPMHLLIAATTVYFTGWSLWLVLPTLFFWTDAFVYGTRWAKPDNILFCELIGNSIRGATVVIALSRHALSVGL